MNLGEFLVQKKDVCESLDAQILLAQVIGRPRTWLLAHLDAPLTPPQVDSANQAFARLEAGEPLPYILGHWEFYGLDFNVTPDVLIPRPETELLVDQAIKWLSAHPQRRSVADVGTGSGIIAVTVAKHIPDSRILATDLSPAALKVAKGNAEKFDVKSQIEFIECDLLPKKSQIDVLCANLPYVPTETMYGLSIYGREPTLALDGGFDGLVLYRRLFDLVPERVAPDGILLLELEATLGKNTRDLAAETFPNATLQLHRDLANHDRLLEIQFNGELQAKV